jgi:hypothetical protein
MKNLWANDAVRQGLVRAARRWAWAAGGFIGGLCSVWGWGWDALEQHMQLQQKVQDLRQAVQSAAPASASSSQLPEVMAGVERLPAVGDAPGLWLALQQGLQREGLQVQSLRPQPLQAGVALSSQAVAMRLQGRFSEVASAWSSLVDAGPVWSLDRMSVTASGPASQLQWEGVWRVWLRPDAPSEQAWPALWDATAKSSSEPFSNPFVSAPVVALAQALESSEPTPALLSADPRQWPLAHIRLGGVWQQGDSRQAVLGAGPHWAVLGPGARLAFENYRIKTVHPDAVDLQAVTGRGPVHVLRLEGVSR